MNTIRAIHKVLKSIPTTEGAGVHLKRVFGYHHKPIFDPFLLLDDFGSDDPQDYLAGFPFHPHRGIETITYLIKGSVEHQDSLGNKGVIHSGDVQWMTAGSGIIHQEMPKESKDGSMRGIQLWANLPAAEKMTDPKYRDVTAVDIPTVQPQPGVHVKVIAGTVDGVSGPVQDIAIKPELLDVRMESGRQFTHLLPHGHTVFAYVLEGAGYFDPERDPYKFERQGRNYFDFERDCRLVFDTLVMYRDGDHIKVEAAEEGVRFILVSGAPLNEPVAWAGPIVMNTHQELRTAFREFHNGTFIKSGKV